MQELEDLSVLLFNFISNNQEIYLRCEPEIHDFTKPYTGKIYLSGKKSEISIPLSFPRLNVVVGILTRTIFSADCLVIAWDIKRLISYIKFNLKNYNLNILARIYDLKLLEAYLGNKQNKPTTYPEALDRFRKIVRNEQAINIHTRIHIPLSLQTIPDIETSSIAEIDRGKVYTDYLIEGQTNGRLSCQKTADNFITPHNLSQEQKEKLRSPSEKSFIYMDYRNMEVSVLQWLTKDEKLGKIIASGKDLYSIIYQLLSGSPCNTKEKRQLIKNAFLPIMYGIQGESLAKQLEIGVSGAKWLIEKIQEYFGTSMKWLEEVQERAKTEVAEDYFGRPRKQENYWAARNMVVQSPAAVVCLEKLIKLHEHLKNVIMSIHDAYVLTVDNKELVDISEAAKSILESPSELCSNLRLKAECKYGTNLAELKSFNE